MGLRLPAAVLAALGVVVAALIAAELGGDKRARVLTAAAYAIPVSLVLTRMLLTATVDTFLWTLVTWLLVRWVRTRQDRLLLLAGLVTAVALQVGFLIGGFWVMLVLTALMLGPRTLLGRPQLWLGAAVASYRSLPPESRQDAVVVTANYWQAAAIDHFGDDTSGVVILVGEDSGRIRQHFSDVRRTATVDNPRGIPVLNADLPVWVCSGQRGPWSRLWPQVRDMLGAPVRRPEDGQP